MWELPSEQSLCLCFDLDSPMETQLYMLSHPHVTNKDKNGFTPLLPTYPTPTA